MHNDDFGKSIIRQFRFVFRLRPRQLIVLPERKETVSQSIAPTNKLALILSQFQLYCECVV